MNGTEHFLAATYRSYWPTPPWSMLSLNWPWGWEG